MVVTDWQNHTICWQGRLQMEPSSLQGAPAPAHSPVEQVLGRKTQPCPCCLGLPLEHMARRGSAVAHSCDFTFVNKTFW